MAEPYSEAYFREWYGCRGAEEYAYVLAEVIRHGAPGPLVDLGAGTGLLAELAYRWGVDVRAFEGSAFAVAEAVRRCPGLPISMLALEDSLPLAGDTVANVVINQVIEHLEPATAAHVLGEARRVLRPGGRVFVFSPSRRNRVEGDGDPTHIRLFLPSELDQAFVLAGLVPWRRLNAGFWFLPRPRWAMHAGRLALQVLPDDLISATANAIALKPGDL